MTRAGRWVTLALLSASACTSAPVRVYNLEQVHAPDGSPKRRGNIQSELGFLFSQAFTKTNFGGEDFQKEVKKEERIKDPYGVCFENLIGLAGCQRDEKVAALQAATYAWLGVDCTYVLSRERCVLEMGSLAQDLGLPKAPAPPSGAPATPEVVKAYFDELVDTVRQVEVAPGLAGDSLDRLEEKARAMPLDRNGALRILRALNGLFTGGEGGAVFAPLRRLRLDLARRCTDLGLREAFSDPQGRVRAAALESSMRAFPLERAERLHWALVDPMEGVADRDVVSLRALQLVAQYGVPPGAPGADKAQADLEREWRDLCLQVLRAQLDGPHTIAACRALARITGEPPTLLPEVWLGRYRASEPESEDTATPPGAKS